MDAWSDFCFAFAICCFVDFLARLEIGSRDITVGLGGTIGPMSTVSTKDILRSQVDVAAIDVGRVNVARIMYEMEPRSNWSRVNECSALCQRLCYEHLRQCS
jgi:hypothetical protein